jgi:hypothetical protein
MQSCCRSRINAALLPSLATSRRARSRPKAVPRRWPSQAAALMVVTGSRRVARCIVVTVFPQPPDLFRDLNFRCWRMRASLLGRQASCAGRTALPQSRYAACAAAQLAVTAGRTRPAVAGGDRQLLSDGGRARSIRSHGCRYAEAAPRSARENAPVATPRSRQVRCACRTRTARPAITEPDRHGTTSRADPRPRLRPRG